MQQSLRQSNPLAVAFGKLSDTLVLFASQADQLDNIR